MNPLSSQTPSDVWHEPSLPKMKQPQTHTVPAAATPQKDYEIVLIEAKKYNDLESIARNIKEQKVVIVNFVLQNSADVQRMVDFLIGAVFALDGETKRISNNSFLFSSSQVDLAGQIMEQKERKSDRTEKGQKDGGFWPQ